jgi:hypothetical protein
MNYVLESDNKDLKRFRERFPIDKSAEEKIQKYDNLLLR